MATTGTYFERIKIISNFGDSLSAEEFTGYFGCTITDSQNVTQVNTGTPDHIADGFVRGNQEVSVTITSYLRYKSLPFDPRSIDYDNFKVDIQLLCPSAQYGTDDVFANSGQYFLIEGVIYDGGEPMNVGQVGTPASKTVTYKFKNYKWMKRAI